MNGRLRRIVFTGAALAALASCGMGNPLDRSIRPEARSPVVTATPAQSAAFRNWVAGFRSRALSQGISAATFDAAFAQAQYRPDVIEKDRNQAEFSRTLRQYLDNAVTDTRITTGRAMLARHAALFSAIEQRYGVEREVVAAIWGMESTYGEKRGDIPTISALATLAQDGRRGSFFESQLVSALKILQRGDVSPANMLGSWAGAMGHTQFIPTSYQSLAVDFTGDGRRDIWSNDPSDALASTANYLAQSGWRKGQPWGVEVRLPAGFNTGLAGRGTSKSPAEWAALGVMSVAGGAVPNHGSASILLPEGASGPAFMIFRNFRAIERYNAADTYVIAVGHLSDRLRGGGPLVGLYPPGERALTEAERMEIQTRLTAAGYDTAGTDGRMGPATIRAIRAWQAANGMAVDGVASVALLNRMR